MSYKTKRLQLGPDLYAEFYIETTPLEFEEEYKCSICRLKMEEEESPLLLWSKSGQDMAMICDDCTPQVISVMTVKNKNVGGISKGNH